MSGSAGMCKMDVTLNRRESMADHRHCRGGYCMRFLSASARFLVLVACVCFSPAPAGANPYLAAPGETPIDLRVATCAVSGGFIHLYTAMDNGLFDKYG